MIKNVIMILTAFAAGSTVTYVGGQATAQAAVAITQYVSGDPVVVPFYGATEDYPALSQRAILNRWVKKYLMAPIETKYGMAANTLSPCTGQARITLVYEPLEEDPTWCNISAHAEVKLPGDFVVGAVAGGQ